MIHRIQLVSQSKINIDVITKIKRCLLRIYSLDQLGNEFREYLNGVKDFKENEDREKRLAVLKNNISNLLIISERNRKNSKRREKKMLTS